eukprot:jgi/Chlat1/9207/Chrsp97S08410
MARRRGPEPADTLSKPTNNTTTTSTSPTSPTPNNREYLTSGPSHVFRSEILPNLLSTDPSRVAAAFATYVAPEAELVHPLCHARRREGVMRTYMLWGLTCGAAGRRFEIEKVETAWDASTNHLHTDIVYSAYPLVYLFARQHIRVVSKIRFTPPTEQTPWQIAKQEDFYTPPELVRTVLPGCVGVIGGWMMEMWLRVCGIWCEVVLYRVAIILRLLYDSLIG